MRLLSNKESKVVSYKYEYNNWEEMNEHTKYMKEHGFKQTKGKYINNNKYSATYVKYCPLGYDE